MNRLGIILVAIFMLAAIDYKNTYASGPLTMEQWESDIEQFREFVFLTHPKFSYNELVGLERNIEMGISFNYALDNLIVELPHSDFKIRVGLQRAAALLQDNHFAIPLSDDSEQFVFPLEMRWLSDGVYLLSTAEGFEEALNGKLVSINDYYIDGIFEDFTYLWSIENVYNARASFADALNRPIILKALGLFNAGDYVIFAFDLDGDIIEIILTEYNKTAMDTSLFVPTFPIDNRIEGDLPLFLNMRGQMVEVSLTDISFYVPDGAIWFYYMEDFGILYIRLEMYFMEICWETFTFPFPEEVKSAFEELSPEVVIIDARDNPGGDNGPFIELFEFLAENTDEGMLIHLINENSLSATLMGAAHLKSLGAIIMGQPSGQNTDFYGFFSFTATGHLKEAFEMLLELENINPDTYIYANISIENEPYSETIRLTIGEALGRVEDFEDISIQPEITLHYSGLTISVPNLFVSASSFYETGFDFYALCPHVTIEHTIYHWINNIDPALEYILNILKTCLESS